MSVPAVMSLSTSGWITDPYRMLDQLLSDFVTADKFQSQWFSKNFHSLASLVQQNGHNPDQLVQAVRSSLTNHIAPHYVQCEVETSWEPLAGETKSNTRYRLNLLITGILDGLPVNLASQFEINETVFSKVMEASNG